MSKLIFELRGPNAKLVRDLAYQQDTDEPDIINRSLNLITFLFKLRKDGTKIILQSATGETGELGDF